MNQPNQLPAHLQNRQSRAIGQTLRNNLSKNNPPHLSIEGGRFTLVDAAGNESPVPTYDPQLGPYIDVNIIDANEHVSKVYWGPDNQYNPNAQSYLPPLCYSDNGVGPSRGSAEPQAPTCLQCPHGVWGSATSRITGKGIKACADLQKLAFTYAGFQMVFSLRVPPNSLKNLGTYQASLGGIDISDLVTRISFVPGIQGTLQFQAVDYIDAATAQAREQALSTNATDNLIGRGDVVHPGAAIMGFSPAIVHGNTPSGPGSSGEMALGGPIKGDQALPASTQQQAQAFQQQPQAVQAAQQNQPVVQQGFQGAIQQPQQGFQAASQPAANGQPPFVVPRQGFAPAAAPQQAVQTPGSASVAQPAVTTSRPRGRPRNNPAPTQQPAPQQPQAPFPTGQQVPQQNGPGANFGIVQGVAPNQELSAALASVFPHQN